MPQLRQCENATNENGNPEKYLAYNFGLPLSKQSELQHNARARRPVSLSTAQPLMVGEGFSATERNSTPRFVAKSKTVPQGIASRSSECIRATELLDGVRDDSVVYGFNVLIFCRPHWYLWRGTAAVLERQDRDAP